MILKKITEENVKSVVGKDIYFIRFFNDYIKEFYGRFSQLSIDGLKGIIDPDVTKQGEVCVDGHTFYVGGYELLKRIPKESALIITTGYYKEEYNNLLSAGIPETGGDTIYYFANNDTDIYQLYLEKYKDEPLRDLIVFRSGMGTWEHVPGMDYTENSRALFEYMQRIGLGKKYEFVWLVKAPELFEKETQKYQNTSFVSYDWATSDDVEKRDKYYRAICLAKYFFFTHACGFCRLPRDGQVRVQLWHGCGFKTVKNTTPQSGRYEFTTVVSRLYAEIHKKEFGLKDEQLLVTGYAKEDWLFSPVEDWKERLSVPEVSKYIFWLPTFRAARDVVSYMNPQHKDDNIGIPIIENLSQLQELNDMLCQKNAVLVVKLHPIQKDIGVSAYNYSNIVFLTNEQMAVAGLHINEILGDADALISDYSSAAVDYLLLNRPIGFTLDDLEEYQDSKGFVLNPIREWLPGAEIFDFGGFKKFITNVCNGMDIDAEKRRRIAKKLHDFDDDRSSERIVRALGIQGTN